MKTPREHTQRITWYALRLPDRIIVVGRVRGERKRNRIDRGANGAPRLYWSLWGARRRAAKFNREGMV